MVTKTRICPCRGCTKAYEQGRLDAARDAAENAELWSYTYEGIPSLVKAVYEAACGKVNSSE